MKLGKAYFSSAALVFLISGYSDHASKPKDYGTTTVTVTGTISNEHARKDFLDSYKSNNAAKWAEIAHDTEGHPTTYSVTYSGDKNRQIEVTVDDNKWFSSKEKYICESMSERKAQFGPGVYLEVANCMVNNKKIEGLIIP